MFSRSLSDFRFSSPRSRSSRLIRSSFLKNQCIIDGKFVFFSLFPTFVFPDRFHQWLIQLDDYVQLNPIFPFLILQLRRLFVIDQ
jgi:hypothetical protein